MTPMTPAVAEAAATAATRRAHEYRDDINGIRAIAVLVVVIYHAFPALMPGGFIGVDVFFVISGFLITGNIIRDVDGGAFTFLDFYARRCRRIVPALAVVLAATWLLGAYLLLLPERHNLAKHIVAGATFTTNLVLWKEAGYFDTAAEMKPLLHLWSLGIEEQFYLLWPPILLLVSATRWRRGAAIWLLLTGSFALNIALISHHAITTFYLLPTRFWELLVGAALAHLQNGSNRSEAVVAGGRPPFADLGRSGWNAIATASIAALIATAFFINGRSSFPGWWALVPTLATAALIYIGERAWVGKALSWKPAVLIGLISYPLYLWHYPLLALGRIVDDGDVSPLARGGLAILATILAWLTWHFIERPIQHQVFVFRGSRRLMRQCVAGSLVCLAAIGSAAWLTRAAQGAAARRQADLLEDVTLLQKLDGQFPACSGALERGRALSWCYTASPGDAEIAIFGDSHAYYLLPGLAEAYRPAGVNVLVIGQTSCPPLSQVRSFARGSLDQCVNANTLALELLTTSPSITTIVLSSLGPYYFSGTSFATDHSGIYDAANWVLEPADGVRPQTKAETFARGLSATLTQLERAGKRVVLFIDVPELDFRPEACIDIRPIRLSASPVRTPCGIERSRVTQRQAQYRDIVAKVVAGHSGTRVFDPLQFLCNGDLCNAKNGDRLFYRDSHHLSVYGSTYLGERFKRWLQTSGSE